jgi:hypothetical protein
MLAVLEAYLWLHNCHSSSSSTVTAHAYSQQYSGSSKSSEWHYSIHAIASKELHCESSILVQQQLQL